MSTKSFEVELDEWWRFLFDKLKYKIKSAIINAIRYTTFLVDGFVTNSRHQICWDCVFFFSLSKLLVSLVGCLMVSLQSVAYSRF